MRAPVSRRGWDRLFHAFRLFVPREGPALIVPDGPARLWGISFLVPDMDATAAALGDLLGAPRDAVQPGRRIATLRREAGLGPAVAFMTPGPGAA